MQQDLAWLVGVSIFTGLEWLPYILERILRVGLINAMGYDREVINNNMASWAQRCQRAHLNATESLIVFTPLVLVAHLVELDILLAIKIFCIARVAHYLCYCLCIPLLRTVAFFAGVGANVYIAYELLSILL